MYRIAALFLFALLLSGPAPAGSMVIPTFDPAEFIHWGPSEQVVEVEFNGTIAEVADWNGDGVKDLLTGVWALTGDGGEVYFYPNIGTDTDPVFDERIRLAADGVPITVPPG